MKPDIWMNGEFVPWDEAYIHPLCHSLQRGSTIFESIDFFQYGPVLMKVIFNSPLVYQAIHSRIFDISRFQETPSLIKTFYL